MEERRKLEISVMVLIALIFAAIVCLAIAAGGCSQVQMSPAYKQQLVMSNILVQSLDKDCRAGDPNACREGLAESADILQLLVDAVEGYEPNGGPVR